MPSKVPTRFAKDTHHRSGGSVQTFVLALIALASVGGLVLLLFGGSDAIAPATRQGRDGVAEASSKETRWDETRAQTKAFQDGTGSTTNALSAGEPSGERARSPETEEGVTEGIDGDSSLAGRARGTTRDRIGTSTRNSRQPRVSPGGGAANSARVAPNYARESDADSPSENAASNSANAPFGSDIWNRIRSIDGRTITDFRDIAAAYEGKSADGVFVLEYEDDSGAVQTQTVPLHFCCNDAPPAAR